MNSNQQHTNPTLCFIGGGNMAASIIGGLINKGFAAKNITAIDPNQERLNYLSNEYGVPTQLTANPENLSADYIFLCVKPQIMQAVCRDLADHIGNSTCFISIAAGIRIKELREWLNTDNTIIRTMPNTPALLGIGATGVFLNSETTNYQNIKNEVSEFFEAIGISVWLNSEEQLDAVTAVSGSGPAYFFKLIEALLGAAEAQGLDKDTAKALIYQTALGAAHMALASDEGISTLRENVTSKGGTTAAALNSLNESNFDDIIKKAIVAATDRSVVLSKELSKP